MNRNLAGRCGMYCGICEIHRGFKDAGKLRMDVAKKHNCQPSDIRCEGCRAVHIIGWARDEDFGRNCQILACLKTRNLETCGDCEKITGCERWQPLAGECEGLGIDLKTNLNSIRQQGLEAWLQAQDERWRCHQCGRTVVVDSVTPRCHQCGVYQL
jgi:hypothetical protein